VHANELKGECEEKDGTKGQESHKASYDETGTIASDEFRHFGSSVLLQTKRGKPIRSSADREGGNSSIFSRGARTGARVFFIQGRIS
jgi:hypothetical protein